MRQITLQSYEIYNVILLRLHDEMIAMKNP